MKRREFMQVVAGAALAMAGGSSSPAAGDTVSPSGKIRIGQIGTRHGHAAGKMGAMRSLSDLYEVVGIVEPDATRRDQLREAKAYRDLPWLTEEQLFNTPGLAAVAVETEVAGLVPTARRCIDAGLHIHLDKPAGDSLPAFEALLKTAEQRERVIQLGYMFRYNPAFRFCFDAVRKGWLGEVFEINGVIGKQVGDAERKELARFPGGAMFELGCHLIDAVVTVLGTPERVLAFNRFSRKGTDDLADNQLAVLEYPGATATVRSSVVEPHGGARRQFSVAGTSGTIEIHPLEPPRMRLALDQPRGDYRTGYQEVPLPKPAGRYDEEFRDLAAIIRGEKTPDWSPAHDLAVQKAVLAGSGMA